MADIYIPQKDKGYHITFTVQDADGNAKALTDYTVTLKVWEAGKPAYPIMSGTCVMTDTAGGICRYTIATNDFLAEGTFQMQLELSKTGIIESTDNYTVEVLEGP